MNEVLHAACPATPERTLIMVISQGGKRTPCRLGLPRSRLAVTVSQDAAQKR
jgi:hypothetical protein